MAPGQIPFTYSADQIATLTIFLSTERLDMYMKAVRWATGRTDRTRKALRRYEYNTALSEALYPVLQGFEVTLRNAIHVRLTTAHGPSWFDTLLLLETEQAAIAEAKRKVVEKPQDLTPDRIVAELNLGFWVRLFSAEYANTLWGPSLSKITPVKDRRALYERLLEIKTLRNRIAHHNRILGRTHPIDESYERILEALDWFSPVACSWVMQTNRVMSLIEAKKPLVTPTVRALGAAAADSKG